jgi:hypothetical protein
MASEMTATKNFLFLAAAGDAAALIPCPSCDKMMAVDETHLRWNIGQGRVAWNAVEVAQASHTTPAADGGAMVALECAACNHGRGRAEWVAPTGTPVAKVGKRAAHVEDTGRVRASRERLA